MNHTRQKNILIYGVCVCCMAVLIAMAFFGPQLIFSVQDSYQNQNLIQGTMDSYALEALYGSYGGLRERLTSFAKRQERQELRITGTVYSVNQDLLDTLDRVLSENNYGMLQEYGMAPPLWEVARRAYEIDQWKQYVIYSDVYEKDDMTVLVSGWYIELTTREDLCVKLFIDTETDELYYLQLTSEAEKDDAAVWGNLYDLELLKYIDYLKAQWFEYYQAGETEGQTYSEYMAHIQSSSETTDAKAESEAAWEIQTKNTFIDKKGYADKKGKASSSVRAYPWLISQKLPYEEYFLNWEMGVDSAGTLYIGLSETADLIPEFQE